MNKDEQEKDLHVRMIAGTSSHGTLMDLQKLLGEPDIHYLGHLTNVVKLRPLFTAVFEDSTFMTQQATAWPFRAQRTHHRRGS